GPRRASRPRGRLRTHERGAGDRGRDRRRRERERPNRARGQRRQVRPCERRPSRGPRTRGPAWVHPLDDERQAYALRRARATGGCVTLLDALDDPRGEVFLRGPKGVIQAVYKRPPGDRVPAALLLHSHPQYGGTMWNRVLSHMSRSMLACGIATL